MFRFLPPASVGGPDKAVPVQSAPWVLVVILMIISGWTREQAILLLPVLVTVVLLPGAVGRVRARD